MLTALKEHFSRRLWLAIYHSILNHPARFSDHIHAITDSRQRLELALDLIRAAAQSAFRDFDSKTFIFYQAEKFGVHFLPVNFESPLPDTRDLGESESGFAKGAGSLLNLNAEHQLQTLYKISHYCQELDIPDHSEEGRFHWKNPAFGPYDAAIYYCMIRHFRPKRIIEIGSGYSTLIALDAVKKNGKTEVTCIEPKPREFLRSNSAIKLLQQDVQSVDLDIFESLEEGDFLFVDGSHVSRIGSDVNNVFFRILPVLSPGVFIHFHDIYFPFDYPKEWVTRKQIFYNEQYVLLAFLAFNDGFETVLAHHFLSQTAEIEMREALPRVPEGPVGGGSFWIRRRG